MEAEEIEFENLMISYLEEEMVDKSKIIEIDQNLTTTSKNVAEVFGKEHKNVLRAIDNLEMSNEFRSLNFELGVYDDANGDGQRIYKMTRDGWSFLVMGFTGAKAAKWKEKYIAAFNAMEKQLKPQLPQTYKEALKELLVKVEENEKLNNQLIEAKPKVESFEAFISSEGLSDVGQVAKILGTGRDRLFAFLRGRKVLMENNIPYQEYVDRGYFTVKKRTEKGNSTSTTMVTPKGVDGIRRIFVD